MKKKVAFIVFLASTLFINRVKADSSQFFTYDEWKEMGSQVYDNHQIVLRNGTKFFGKIEKVPTLCYPFATFDFQVHEIVSIKMGHIKGAAKLQYTTRNGQNFIASIANDKFICSCKEVDLNGKSIEILKEIDPSIIDYILLLPSSLLLAHYNSQLASLTFLNGDQLPVTILSDPIIMTNGWTETSIQSANILQLFFEGGLHAKILKEGQPVSLEFNFIKDPYLFVHIERNQHHMKFPWTQINLIQYRNGGFYREKGVLEDFSQNLSNNSPVNINHQKIGIGWHKANESPDQIGLNKGELLIGAFAAGSISQDAITGLSYIGNEELVAIDKIFNDEEALWLSDVEFMMDEFGEGETIQINETVEDVSHTPLIALDKMFDENEADGETTDIAIQDLIIPLFEDDLLEDDRVQNNFITFEEDTLIYSDLSTTDQNTLLAVAEDFDLNELNPMSESFESEIEYLEDIAHEVDMMALSEEPLPEIIENKEKSIIGIDEIIEQENEFFVSENMDSLEIVNNLWSENTDISDSSLETEKMFIDSLWN